MWQWLSNDKSTLSWHSKGLPLLLVALLASGGCASTQTAENTNPDDPWEGFNRKVFAFNDVLDRYALKPVARGYRTITPDPVETGVGNFFSNLGEIRTALNSVLQGKPANAGLATSRFLINSTVGIGGLLDYATLMEIKRILVKRWRYGAGMIHAIWCYLSWVQVRCVIPRACLLT